MAKNPTERPSISERDMVRLLIASYGPTQTLRYFNSELRRQIDRTNMFVESNNPLAVSQGLALMNDINRKMQLILGDNDNTAELEEKLK